MLGKLAQTQGCADMLTVSLKKRIFTNLISSNQSLTGRSIKLERRADRSASRIGLE